MGEVVDLSCSKCNFKKQLNIGSGRLSIQASVVESTLTGEDLDAWKKLQEQGKIGFFSWQYDLAYCDSCKDLKSVFSVNVKNQEESIRIGGRCDTCKKQLHPAHNNEPVMCPVCKVEQIQRMRIGMWS